MIDRNAGHAYIDMPTKVDRYKKASEARTLVIHVYIRDTWSQYALIEPVSGGGQAWVRLDRLRSTREPLPPAPSHPGAWRDRMEEIKRTKGWGHRMASGAATAEPAAPAAEPAGDDPTTAGTGQGTTKEDTTAS